MRIYVDNLTLSLFVKSFSFPKKTEIVYLNTQNIIAKMPFVFLRLLGIRFSEAKFFLGDLGREDSRNLYVDIYSMSSRIAFYLSDEIFAGDFYKTLNEDLGRNTIKLYIAKIYQAELHPFIKRLLTAQAISDKTDKIYLQKPHIISRQTLYRFFPNKQIEYYNPPLWLSIYAGLGSFAAFFKLQCRYLYIRLLSFLLPIQLNPEILNTPIVLSPSEDSFRQDLSYRSQQFWLTENIQNIQYVVLDRAVKYGFDGNIVSVQNAIKLPFRFLGIALGKNRKHKKLRMIHDWENKIIKKLMRTHSLTEIKLQIHLYNFLEKSIEIGSVALTLGAKYFLFKETDNIYADAIQPIAETMALETIAIQYSSMPIRSAHALTTADKFLTFSEIYKDLFKTEHISPREMIIIGYPYRHVVPFVKTRALEKKKALQSLGVQTIIGYFDENIWPDKWGLVSKTAHLSDLHFLANKIIKNPSLAIIIKTKFRINLPSQVYKNDALLTKAYATGRLLEFCEGAHRNDVYPAEIACMSDICIGYHIGATACLESALAGCKSVILGDFNVDAEWATLIRHGDIIFPNLAALFEKMETASGEINMPITIGDWRKHIRKFDPFADMHSHHRIEKAIFATKLD